MPTTLPPLPAGFSLENAPSGGNLPPLPSGFTLEKPSGVPGWAQDLVKYGPGFLKEGGSVIGQAFMKGLAALGEGAAGVAGENMRPEVPGPDVQKEITNAFPAAQEMPEGLPKRVLQGIGGTASMPIGGPMSIFLGGAGSGAGGFVGRKVAEGFSSSPIAQNVGDVVGSLFGGGLGGYAGSPSQSVAANDVKRALTGTTPTQFQDAIANALQAQSVGAKTATAPEMFAPNSGIMTLGTQTRGGNLTNALRTQTADRSTDLESLANEFLNRISPNEVSPNVVANQTGQAATGAQLALKDIRGEAIGNALMGQILKPAQTVGMENSLKALAASPGIRPEMRQAYQEVASRFRDADGTPLTSVQQLSLAIKNLKAAAQNPMTQTSTGAQISSNDLNQAIGAAESMLAQESPAFGQAMGDFKAFTNGPMAQQSAGPIGSLAFRNPNRPTQTSPARLDALISGNSPQDVTGAMTTLQSPVMTGGPTASAEDIARAIAQKALFTSKQNPGAAVRGDAGSAKEANLSALLESAGKDPSQVLAPLATADRLQAFSQPAGVNEFAKMQMGQLLLRPFRTLDMMMTGKSVANVSDEVARLLADPSPANILALQKISMFDPQVRKIMTLRAAATPALTEENK